MEKKTTMLLAFVILDLNLLFHKLASIVCAIWWWLTGRAAEIASAQANYETSAHVMGYLHKFLFDLAWPVGRLNFLLYHHSFVHPEYVLKDEVTLMQITATEAIFVEAKPGMDHAFKSTYSYSLFGQYQTAGKVIVMPLSSLLRLSQEMKVDDEDAKTIFIFNQGRAGSTLLTSVFEHTNRCLAISEPFALNAICKQVFQDKRFSREEGLRMVRATVRLLRKPYRGLRDGILAYVIKPSPMTSAAVGLIQEAVPESKSVFLYRDPVELGQSARRIAEAIPTLKFIYYLMEVGIPNACCLGLSFIGIIGSPFDGFTSKAKTGLEFGYYLALQTLFYREQVRRKGVEIPAIRFDDLRDQPKIIIGKIFEFCGLPQSLVPAAVEAMNRDAHHATRTNSENLRRLMPIAPVPTTPFIEEMRAVARKYSLPEPEKWVKDFRVENSIVP